MIEGALSFQMLSTGSTNLSVMSSSYDTTTKKTCKPLLYKQHKFGDITSRKRFEHARCKMFLETDSDSSNLKTQLALSTKIVFDLESTLTYRKMLYNF